MLRRPFSSSELVQSHEDQDGPLRGRIVPDHAALLQLLGHAVPSNSVQLDPHMFSDTEKNNIYTDWIRAGKPHSLVCSECRNPDDLMLCDTCCRSYHAKCLPGFGAATSTSSFHCPSCKDKHWDQTPPSINPLLISPDVSRSSTPSAMSMSPHAIIGSRKAPVRLGATQSSLQGLSLPSSPDSDQLCIQNGFSVPSPDVYSRARQFLIQHGQFPPSRDFRPGLLLKLGTMMLELDSQQRLLQEIQDLREENASLRNEMLNTRKLISNRMTISEPIINSPSSNLSPTIQTPSDTTGKSWDRIVLDLL